MGEMVQAFSEGYGFIIRMFLTAEVIFIQLIDRKQETGNKIESGREMVTTWPPFNFTLKREILSRRL